MGKKDSIVVVAVIGYRQIRHEQTGQEMRKTFSALLLSALTSLSAVANANEPPIAVLKTSVAPAADFVEAFGTHVFSNDGPCTPANAPAAAGDPSGRYIGLFPGGEDARAWDISVQLDKTKTVFDLGAGVLPLVYGVTADGKYMVRTHGMPLNDNTDVFVFQGLFPIWGVMLEQKWACYYLPGYPYPVTQ